MLLQLEALQVKAQVSAAPSSAPGEPHKAQVRLTNTVFSVVVDSAEGVDLIVFFNRSSIPLKILHLLLQLLKSAVFQMEHQANVEGLQKSNHLIWQEIKHF